MKKIVLLLLSFIIFNSCNSQEKVDLEKIAYSKNYKEILKNTKLQTDGNEIVTSLPVAYTKNVAGYKFGNVSFLNDGDSEIKSSTVGILINNSKERKTVGIKVEIENTAIGEKLLTYLKSNYKNEIILSKIPPKNNEGEVLGNSAYLWEVDKKTIVLIQYYEYTNKKPNISSVLYAVSNEAISQNYTETVAAHLKRTYTP